MTSTEQTPVLGRCKHAGCDYALWSAPEDIRQAASLNDVVPGAAFRMTDKGNLLARCPNKHKVFRLYQVEGEYDPDVKCDGRCEGARGHVCRCACGGMNHGRGHAGTVENVSTTIVIDADEYEAARRDPVVKATLAAADAAVQDDEQQVTDGEPLGSALFGFIGGQIFGTAQVTHKQDTSDSTLYLFRACIDGNYGTLKWFAPSYANPDFAKGDRMNFQAKVKAHQDNEYGRMTVVTYFEAKSDA